MWPHFQSRPLTARECLRGALDGDTEAPDVEPTDMGRASEDEDDGERAPCPEDALVAHGAVKAATTLVEEMPELS